MTDTVETTETVYFTYSEDGYYTGNTAAAEQPENSTTTAPEFDPAKWAKWSGKKWAYETKPTSAADLEGVTVPAALAEINGSGYTSHDAEIYALMNRYLDADHVLTTADDVIKFETVPLDTLKTRKLSELSVESEKYQAWNCKDMYITSSLGFAVNSDQCSQNNMQQLINLLPDDVTTTSFKIYDNTFKALTRVDLNTLLQESVQAGLQMYATKFALQAKIAAATSKEELDAIEIKFEMVDFTADKTDE